MTLTRAVAQRIAPDPLVRNGYALVSSTVVTGALGVVYWVAAARLVEPRELGIDAAALTAVMLVASVAGMNLSGALVFLLPKLGPSIGRVIGRSYAAATAAALALGTGTAVVVRGLEGDRDFLGGSTGLAALFVLACAGWVLFTVQDGVLVGLQRAGAVLLENTSYGVAKLALLAGLAWWGSEHSVLLSWVLPVLLLVPLVNGWIVRRLIPATRDRSESSPPQGLRRFLGLNYASSLVYQAYVHLLPLVVLVVLGAEANGLFYVAWTWSTSIDLVSHAMGASLTVEGSAQPERLGAHLRRTCERLAMLVVPGVVAVVLGAPLLLGVYGDAYLASTGVLQLLALGALPRGALIVVQAASRARGEAGLVLWTEAVVCVLSLVLTLALLGSQGAAAVGIAWLVANAVAAALVAPRLLAELRS